MQLCYPIHKNSFFLIPYPGPTQLIFRAELATGLTFSKINGLLVVMESVTFSPPSIIELTRFFFFLLLSF